MLMSRRWCCGVSVTLTSRSVLSRWFELNYLKINFFKDALLMHTGTLLLNSLTVLTFCFIVSLFNDSLTSLCTTNRYKRDNWDYLGCLLDQLEI